MSGWLLLVALLAAGVVAWLLVRGRRQHKRDLAAYLGPGSGRGRPRGGRWRKAGRPGPGAWPGRPARPIVDAEFSSETFVPPEVTREPGRDDRGPGPWGRVAVPAWEHPVPWSYGDTRLVLMVRDPYWLFTYWEITGDAHRAAADMVGREKWFTARPVIRVYDVSAGSHYDVGVDEEARNWYLNVSQPDRTWYIELGRLTEDGRFVMLARSNSVHTPRDGPSKVIDPRWPPLGLEGFRPEGMPASPGMAMPSSPGAPGSPWTRKSEGGSGT